MYGHCEPAIIIYLYLFVCPVDRESFKIPFKATYIFITNTVRILGQRGNIKNLRIYPKIIRIFEIRGLATNESMQRITDANFYANYKNIEP